MALKLHEQLQYLADDASPYEPVPQIEESCRAMQWQLLRVTEPQRDSLITDLSRSTGGRLKSVDIAVATRVVRLQDGERFDLIAFTSDARTVCEMSAKTSGFGYVKLTNGHIILEQSTLRGWRIGSFCFNQVVRWAKAHWPDHDVAPIRLLASDAIGINRLRRNAFYEQFGIRFTYEERNGIADAAGESMPMKADALVDRDLSNFPNIRELDLPHVFGAATQLLPRSQRRVVGLKSALAEQRRESNKSLQTSIRYLNWFGYFVAVVVGAALMKLSCSWWFVPRLPHS